MLTLMNALSIIINLSAKITHPSPRHPSAASKQASDRAVLTHWQPEWSNSGERQLAAPCHYRAMQGEQAGVTSRGLHTAAPNTTPGPMQQEMKHKLQRVWSSEEQFR